MKLVCAKCQIGMKNVKSGVSIIEMYSYPPTPYRIWSADLFQCPICEQVIVATDVRRPVLHEFDGEAFDKCVQDDMDSGLAVIEYERISDAKEASSPGYDPSSPLPFGTH